MPFQPESATWEAGVLQLETATPVQGGVGGASNAPLLHLSNRTAYLKQHVDALEAASASLAPLNSPAFTGSPTVPDVTTGDSSGKAANTKFVQNTVGGILTKNVAGSSNVTLTAAECGYAIIVLTGVLTGNINVIVPSGAGTSDKWIFYNATTGNFTITVKTAAGAGVLVNQSQSYVLYCDTVDVRAAGAANQSSFSTIKITATAGQTNLPALYTPGNVLVFKNGALLTPVDDFVAVSGNDIGLTVAAVAGDEFVIFAYSSFTTAGAVAKTGDTMLGALLLAAGSTAVTQASGDNTTNVATDEFVIAEIVNQFNKSGQQLLAATGYQKLPGGLLLQWGRQDAVGNADVTVTLPVAYPSGVFRTYATMSGGGVPVAVSSAALSASQISVRAESTANVNWFAIGN